MSRRKARSGPRKRKGGVSLSMFNPFSWFNKKPVDPNALPATAATATGAATNPVKPIDPATATDAPDQVGGARKTRHRHRHHHRHRK